MIPTTNDPTPAASAAKPRALGAVLFDMDGTLIDTEAFWHRSETAIVESYGKTWTEEQGLALIGLPVDHAAATIVAQTGIPLDPVEYRERMIAGVLAIEEVEGLPWLPGALELLTALRDAGVPCALVTSSYRRLTTRLQEEAPVGALHAVVAAEDVANHKPAPDPYLRGAQLLGVDPARCVAVEDSPAGLAAAAAAGCRVIGIPRSVPLPEGLADGPSGARAASLTQLDVGVLERFAAGGPLRPRGTATQTSARTPSSAR